MTSHKDHDHPNTAKARAACRRREILAASTLMPQDDPNMPGRVLEYAPVGIPTFTRTTQTHCESCGSVDIDDIMNGDQGYTDCCNELPCHGDYTVVWAWKDFSNNTTGTIESCCAARITFPHDMMRITHRA